MTNEELIALDHTDEYFHTIKMDAYLIAEYNKECIACKPVGYDGDEYNTLEGQNEIDEIIAILQARKAQGFTHVDFYDGEEKLEFYSKRKRNRAECLKNLFNILHDRRLSYSKALGNTIHESQNFLSNAVMQPELDLDGISAKKQKIEYCKAKLAKIKSPNHLNWNEDWEYQGKIPNDFDLSAVGL